MGWDSNPYSSPEKFGLERVAEIEYSSGAYEFDTRMVWRETATGRLLTARDSGCSCPCPFEDTGLNTMEKASATALQAEFDAATRNEWASFDKEAARRELNKALSAIEEVRDD